MKPITLYVVRILLTVGLVAIAALVLWRLVHHYMFEPWTRDAHVRADAIEVAPDVSGLITAVAVVDNQPVKKGQRLFQIDEARYSLALRNAIAVAHQRSAELDEARREHARNRVLGDLIANETMQQGYTRVLIAQAALDEAQTAVDTARLNLQRTDVVSPVDGQLTDRAPRTGEYVMQGRPTLSVVDAHSFRVDAYFEETRLHDIEVGRRVDIKVMGESTLLSGHVESIAAGVEDRDRSEGAHLLPDVNPAFSWVRLAQRIPVRIALDDAPKDFHLISGRTATVSVRAMTSMQRAHR